jgi:CubicO group peptidase (beta-lactamase class C family)
MKCNAVLVLTILFLTSVNVHAEKISLNKKELNNKDIFFENIVNDASIPGVAVAKITNSEVTFLKTYGYANVENKTLVTEDTMFNIASISKPIMGVSLLQLVDKNKLALDTNINNYLPFKIDNPSISNEKITLRHLATHTSGINDYYDPDSFEKNKDSNISLEYHLKSLLMEDGSKYRKGKYYLNQAPGEDRKYSNLGAGLAGYLVEATTGISLAKYSQQTIFDSLYMKNTAWLLNGLNLDNVAVPYSITEQGEFQSYDHTGNPQYPDGGIRSSIRDLSTFMTALLKNSDINGNKLLSDETYKEMFKLQLKEEISTTQRFFWSDNQMGLTGHMGSDPGVFTAFYFNTQSRDGIIILMNIDMNKNSADAMKKIAYELMTL